MCLPVQQQERKFIAIEMFPVCYFHRPKHWQHNKGSNYWRALARPARCETGKNPNVCQMTYSTLGGLRVTRSLRVEVPGI